MTPDEARRRLEAVRLRRTAVKMIVAAHELYQPQRRPAKAHVSIRIDADVLDAFKATGKGWQRLVNDVLRANMPSPS